MASSNFSRRTLLKSLGVGALGVGLGSSLPLGAVRRARAQDSLAGVRPSAFTNFNVGDFELTVIQDGVGAFPAAFFAANADPEEVNTLLEANGLSGENPLRITVNTMLVNTGDSLTLIDTGYGDLPNEDGTPTGGRLFSTLTALGLSVEDIETVILTHFHPDHALGMAIDGAVAFPNASYYFPQEEYDFLQATDSTGDPAFDGIINLAKADLQVVSDADQLFFYQGDGEIVPGIAGVPAFGHSPGQYGLAITSGSETLYHLADAAANEIISVQHPEWYFGFDAIPDLAVETRRTLLGRAAAEQARVFTAHFAYPSVGYIVEDGDAFRYTASV